MLRGISSGKSLCLPVWRCSGVCVRKWYCWSVGCMLSTVAPPVHTPTGTGIPEASRLHYLTVIKQSSLLPPSPFLPWLTFLNVPQKEAMRPPMCRVLLPFKTSVSNIWMSPHPIACHHPCTKYQLGHSQMDKGWCVSFKTY